MAQGQLLHKHKALSSNPSPKKKKKKKDTEISPYSNQNSYHQEHNQDDGVAQVVEHMPSKNEALSSNPIIAKQQQTTTTKPKKQKQTTYKQMLERIGEEPLYTVVRNVN
jgi:hypothetical protein